MRNALGIARRELAAYFNAPVAYIVLGVFLGLSGWLYFWFSGLFLAGQASLRPFFALAPLLFLFFAPAVTMRLLAEERKSGTIEALLTLPVRDGEVVAGKFLAALGTMAVGLAFTLPWPITIALLTAEGARFDWGPVFAGYLGLLLLASALLSVGLWASALSRNQVVGFILGLAAAFVLWILDKAALVLPSELGALLQYASIGFHFENFAKGVIDSRDVLYYLTVTAIGLLLTERAVASVRK
jgi:ABC-2 type transport system permease protein